MKPYLKSVLEGGTLTAAEAAEAMGRMLASDAVPEQVAAFLAALELRGATVAELAGFLLSLREKAVRVSPKRSDLMDTCGTGGDGFQTFNISTAAAFVLAGAGVAVAKHGNRSVSSRSGSADVIEALGLPLKLTPGDAAASLDDKGFAFLFAPGFHPALAAVAPVRRAMGVRTVFNLLGPLANPAPVKKQLVGVYARKNLETFATLLRETGTESALIVSSAEGMDELSLSGPTFFARLSEGEIELGELTPEDFGLPRAPVESLRGGDAGENAILIERILQGEERGPKRDVVLMNTAAALVVSGKAKTFPEGVRLATASVESGKAFGVLVGLRGGPGK